MTKPVLDKQSSASSSSMSSMESDIERMRFHQRIEQMATPEFQVIVTKPAPDIGSSRSPKMLTPNTSFVYKSESRRHTGNSIYSEDVHDTGSRRPSLFNGQPRQSFSVFKKQMIDFLHRHGSRLSLNKKEDHPESPIINQSRSKNRAIAEDQISTAISALYAKLLIVLGIAFPITDVVTDRAAQEFYQGFYLYLYFVSVVFIGFLYIVRMRAKTQLKVILEQYQHPNTVPDLLKPSQTRFGSFYLRAGAIAFGIGSMVHSGLEFGQYFELKRDERCQNVLIALIPAARICLCLVQMQFIFFTSGLFHMERHKFVSRFGLMHMLATNVCEWLYVIIEEAKHEIVHIAHGGMHGGVALASTAAFTGNDVINNRSGVAIEVNESQLSQHYSTDRDISSSAVIYGFECRRTNIMGSLVQNAAPFLFPCTIEYSLICAVILFEMWKKVRQSGRGANGSRRNSRKSLTGKSGHLLSVDCSNAQRGMFGGILIIVLTIIVLIMYFVLQKERYYKKVATIEVTISEIIIYSITAVAVVWAMVRMRDLKFSQKKGDAGISLDCTLLILAQVGIYIYTMFSIIGTFFSIGVSEYATVYSLLAEFISFTQTSLQTLFIMNTWWRRCKGAKQNRSKPGREIITFLLIANMSIWFINTLIKTNGSFRPTLMNFYGVWAWTIITHLSMPLAIFYRFHSTICLFEIWKNTYKVRYERSN
ncbi:proton channel OtopLc-like isoform X2 [Malaya genurostris]|uniref:proton channel OtopLc-like isoform X2 n=1 Tax=Malaya genurostris TaxID=325434 RepID=UPI0026F3F4B7|nr:proton channel OtopLc-like isoform X2 [Malaya genurostris]